MTKGIRDKLQINHVTDSQTTKISGRRMLKGGRKEGYLLTKEGYNGNGTGPNPWSQLWL